MNEQWATFFTARLMLIYKYNFNWQFMFVDNKCIVNLYKMKKKSVVYVEINIMYIIDCCPIVDHCSLPIAQLILTNGT